MILSVLKLLYHFLAQECRAPCDRFSALLGIIRIVLLLAYGLEPVSDLQEFFADPQLHHLLYRGRGNLRLRIGIYRRRHCLSFILRVHIYLF